MKRIYWWRFFFDTFWINYNPDKHAPHVGWVCRLMLPCADNYRPPRARNDNGR
jgi:hypothetical protein